MPTPRPDSHSRILTAQDSLGGVDLAAASSSSWRVSFGRVLEDSKGAKVLWIVTISHARDLVVIPTKKASFDGRLESAEDLDVGQLSRLVACLTACSVVALVALHFLNDSAMVLDKTLFQGFPLIWPNARV